MFKNLVDFSAYETFAVVAMVFFFAVFVALLFYVFSLKAHHITEMENLPLQSDDSTITAAKEQE